MRAEIHLIFLIVLVGTRTAAAGCAKEIFDCRARNLCASKKCSSGMVCRVENCGGCNAQCEPPGTVHVMSVSRPLKLAEGDNRGQPDGPCPCNRSFLPVCGSDGKFYANECLAKCAKVSVAGKPDKDRKCPTAAAKQHKVFADTGACRCPRILMPVCSSDGKAYSNACEAKCAKVTVVGRPDKEGKCQPAAGSNPRHLLSNAGSIGRHLLNLDSSHQGFTCRCKMSYEPVCGADGKFYDNECLAICAGTKVAAVKPNVTAKACPDRASSSKPLQQSPAGVAQAGEPGAGCKCPRIFKQVCGSDGKVYANECLAKCAGAQVTKQHPEKCDRGGPDSASAPGKVCACPKILLPVCGSDGKVYSNECLAKCAGVTSTGQRPGPNQVCAAAKAP